MSASSKVERKKSRTERLKNFGRSSKKVDDTTNDLAAKIADATQLFAKVGELLMKIRDLGDRAPFHPVLQPVSEELEKRSSEVGALFKQALRAWTLDNSPLHKRLQAVLAAQRGGAGLQVNGAQAMAQDLEVKGAQAIAAQQMATAATAASKALAEQAEKADSRYLWLE